MRPDLKINNSGGFLVWQDNRSDGEGLGLSARRLDATLSGVLSTFRINESSLGDQENARVTLLNGGGAAFVWQGGQLGFQHIYARFLSANNTWSSGDIHVNTGTTGLHIDPAVATLANGNVVVVWSSVNEYSTNSLRDVYAQILSPVGAKIGTQFPVNQFTDYNQRTPVVAALAGGGFVVAWVSEQQRTSFNVNPNMLYPRGGLPIVSVDIFARTFTAAGVALGSEFLVNTADWICANPSIAASSEGGFGLVWGQADAITPNNAWDIYGRVYSSAGTASVVRRINAVSYGDQVFPQLGSSGSDYLVSYTSLAQDSSREGVFAQFLKPDGSLLGDGFKVNTTTPSQQMHQRVAADSSGRFLVAWTSFIGSTNNFDLFAQRYDDTQQALQAPEAPFVTVLGSNVLAVSWPTQSGLSVLHYEIYADGSLTPTALVTNNSYWAMGDLAAGSTHSFRLAYVLADERRSPLSAPTSGTTYGAMSTWGGIPQEWMTAHFGADLFTWPSPYADTDGDGASNRNEFLAGTDPLSAASVLRIRLEATSQGLFLNWNTEPALVYQVQSSTDMENWNDVGQPRFAAGAVDSMYVGPASVGFYRVIRLR
jgi:hypothetical protein